MLDLRNRVRKIDSLLVTGIALIILALSNIPYLFKIPLRSTPGIQWLSKEAANSPALIKDEVGFKNKTQPVIESNLVYSFRLIFAKTLLICFLGILSGILVLKRNIIGYFLAIGISCYMLLISIIHFASLEHPLELLYYTHTKNSASASDSCTAIRYYFHGFLDDFDSSAASRHIEAI